MSSPGPSNRETISGSGNMEYISNACDSNVYCCFFMEQCKATTYLGVNNRSNERWSLTMPFSGVCTRSSLTMPFSGVCTRSSLTMPFSGVLNRPGEVSGVIFDGRALTHGKCSDHETYRASKRRINMNIGEWWWFMTK